MSDMDALVELAAEAIDAEDLRAALTEGTER